MTISPENFWREVWHSDCVPGRGNGMMIYDNHYKTTADGSVLRRFKCLHCGERAYAGLDSRRFVIVDPEPTKGATA